MGCKRRAFRYAVAKSDKDVLVCGILCIRLKLGNKSAVVVFGVSLFGKEDAVMRTLVKGYIDYSLALLTLC